jgi:hypothetical protein
MYRSEENSSARACVSPLLPHCPRALRTFDLCKCESGSGASLGALRLRSV